jgi:hypothetical protein
MVLCKTFRKIRLKTNNYTELDKLFKDDDDDIYEQENFNEFTKTYDFLNKYIFDPLKTMCIKK